jgi:hypothetical protein
MREAFGRYIVQMANAIQEVGNAKPSRTDRYCATDVTIAVHALNHMVEFGCPEAIQVA